VILESKKNNIYIFNQGSVTYLYEGVGVNFGGTPFIYRSSRIMHHNATDVVRCTKSNVSESFPAIPLIDIR